MNSNHPLAGCATFAALRRGRRVNALHGFTLIELLVVIAILSLLVSILLPSLKKAKTLAQRAVCASNLRSLAMGGVLYASENDNKLIPGPETNNFYKYTHYWMDANWTAANPGISGPQAQLLAEAAGAYQESVSLLKAEDVGLDASVESVLEKYGRLFQCPEGRTVRQGERFGWQTSLCYRSQSWGLSFSYAYIADNKTFHDPDAGKWNGKWGHFDVDLPEEFGQTEHKNLKGVASTHAFFDRPVTQVLFADTSMNTTSSWLGPVGIWSGNHVDDPDVPQGNSAYHDGHVEWHSGLEEVEDFYNGGGGRIKF